MNYNYAPFSSPFKIVCPHCSNRQSIQTIWQRCNHATLEIVASGDTTTFKAPSWNTWSSGATYKSRLVHNLQ